MLWTRSVSPYVARFLCVFVLISKCWAAGCGPVFEPHVKEVFVQLRDEKKQDSGPDGQWTVWANQSWRQQANKRRVTAFIQALRQINSVCSMLTLKAVSKERERSCDLTRSQSHSLYRECRCVQTEEYISFSSVWIYSSVMGNKDVCVTSEPSVLSPG